MRTFRFLLLVALGVWLVEADGVLSVRAEVAAGRAGPTVLELKNGDRVSGRLLGVDDQVIRFQSDNFGLLEVRRDQLLHEPVEPASAEGESSPVTQRSSPGQGPGEPAAPREPKQDPWTFWLNLSTELKRDGSSHKNVLVEGTARREWARGEFRTKASYEFKEENDRTTTDLQKFELYGRYDVVPRWFLVYSPQEEFNRHQVISGVRINYVFLRQMVGFGRTVIDTKAGRLRFGVAENFFDVWAWRGNRRVHGDYRTESLFTEAEFALPWKLSLMNRASVFYALAEGDAGYESIFELTRRLDTHWRLTLRQELRHNYPGINVGDLNLWRLIFGLEY